MSVPAYQSITEFYQDPGTIHAGFPQEHRSGGSMSIKVYQANQKAFEGEHPAIPEICLVLLRRGNITYRWDVGDGWIADTRIRPGDFCLFPAHTAVGLECHGAHDLMGLALSEADLRTLLIGHGAGRVSDLEPLTTAGLFRDEAIRRTVLHLWAESTRSGGTSDLLIDGLTQVLIARLLDKAGALARPVTVPTLSRDEIARLDRLIADRLAERITVETLARALDMPRWTFADAFKATTGETPHAYVTARRIARACDLLRFGDLPLAEIAYATGFASQSHMTDTFRRHLGTTPGAWRREFRW